MMNHMKAWQNFVNEGGIKSAKTDARLTPELVVKSVDVYKRVMADFNNWLGEQNQTVVRPLRPVGSVSYVQSDLQDNSDVVYGDVDYLVEFPLPPSQSDSYTEKRKEENATRRKYRKLFFEFLASPSVTPEVDVYETLGGEGQRGDPFMVILEAHPDVFVQIDTVITFPDYAEWLSTRYTPERGIKGYTMGKLYKALGDFFPFSISTEGVIARTKNGKLVTSRLRKGVELEMVSSNPKTFLLDMARYVLGDEDIQIHPAMKEQSGMTGDITLAKLAQGIVALALTLDLNGRLRADDMVEKILMNYEEGLEEHLTRTGQRIEKKASKLQDEAQRVKLLNKIDEIAKTNAKALKLVSKELRV